MKAPLLISFLLSCHLQAQFITGKVRDAETQEPLPYVNIGVLNHNLGTVSDE